MLVAFWTIGIIALFALLAVVVIGDFLDGIFDALDFSDRKSTRLNSSHWE